MATEIDWPQIVIQAASAMASAVGGLLLGAWRWGRQSAEREQKLKDDLMLRTDEIEKASDHRLDGLIEQFKETFAGLRRQIDDDRLRNEQTFLRKEDFRDFREEYRQDMRDIKESIKDLGKH